ncbi:MAG: prenyltransferase, partial [Calditrichaeota bacterium]|nr:prenyltransferase [Calditrichota bacterium]
RARLRLEKGQPFQPWWSHGSHLAALALLALLAVYGRVPWLAAAAEGILLVRAAAGLSAFRKAIKAKQVGFQEIAYGLIFVLLAAMGYWWRL